jgi:hypothetical protein
MGRIAFCEINFFFLFLRPEKIYELVECHQDRWLCKEIKFKAREFRGARRTDSTPQRQRDEAQRRNWAIYEAVEIYLEWQPVQVVGPVCGSFWLVAFNDFWSSRFLALMSLWQVMHSLWKAGLK